MKHLNLTKSARVMTDTLEKMKTVAVALEAAYRRLNAEIEFQEQLIRDTGLTVNNVMMPLRSTANVALTWKKRDVGGNKDWRLCIVTTMNGGKDTPREVTPLTHAQLDQRIEAYQRIGEFHTWLLKDATQLVNTLTENFPEDGPHAPWSGSDG
jgi:hypothetical protein